MKRRSFPSRLACESLPATAAKTIRFGSSRHNSITWPCKRDKSRPGRALALALKTSSSGPIVLPQEQQLDKNRSYKVLPFLRRFFMDMKLHRWCAQVKRYRAQSATGRLSCTKPPQRRTSESRTTSSAAGSRGEGRNVALNHHSRGRSAAAPCSARFATYSILPWKAISQPRAHNSKYGRNTSRGTHARKYGHCRYQASQ
jgi:hypothetical protein